VTKVEGGNLKARKPEKELGEEETRRIRAAVRMNFPAFLPS
jgi:hypothetical protein